eukprot:TRINITY_DN1045_c0_g1_i2.p1 TRINITY_DN1045_c0_g1~~TRINITY_DN1045_c0_g1_i2.p1  ORF type:complete len:282 (+),score=29.66 TRINITY_DN1045_c0_g1_i2:181-1026(+)
MTSTFKIANLQFNRARISVDEKFALVQSAINAFNLFHPETFYTDQLFPSIPTDESNEYNTFGIIVAPEYFWGSKASVTEQECHDIVDRLRGLARNNKRILFVVGTISFHNENQVRNMAPIFYHSYSSNGPQLIEDLYYKINGFHENGDNNNLTFVGGEARDRSLLWNLAPRNQKTLSFSVEICLDHIAKTASRSIQYNAQRNVYMLDPRLLARGNPQSFAIVMSDFCQNLKYIEKPDGASNWEDITLPSPENPVISIEEKSTGQKIAIFKNNCWSFHNFKL